MALPTQLPHKFSYRVAILGHKHFELPNTGCLMKNASTHNFFIYDRISMNKKIKGMVFQALQNSHKIYFFGLRLETLMFHASKSSGN
jgi:hypothetical protein